MTAPALRAVDTPAPADGDGREPTRLRRELRAIHALVHRDLLRLSSQPTHTALMLLQPVLYLFILGGGGAGAGAGGALGGGGARAGGAGGGGGRAARGV
ncbi:hypothetical protein ACWCO4_36400, partial [Streptomyces virginiae]